MADNIPPRPNNEQAETGRDSLGSRKPPFSNLPNGLVLRPANPTDQAFIESLYASTRDDLRLIDGEREFVESIIDMQYRAQTQGYGTTVLQAAQQAASTIKAPVSLSVATANLMAKQLYSRLGFRTEESSEMYERMI